MLWAGFCIGFELVLMLVFGLVRRKSQVYIKIRVIIRIM